jgi:hypothetical protein
LIGIAYGQFRWKIAFPPVNGSRAGSSVNESRSVVDICGKSGWAYSASGPSMNDRIMRIVSWTCSSLTVIGRSPIGPKRFSWSPKYAPPKELIVSLNVQQASPT